MRLSSARAPAVRAASASAARIATFTMSPPIGGPGAAPSRRGADPPRREARADQGLWAREIVDQLEACAARGGVGDHPVADLVRAIAGARQRLGEELCEPALLAVLEMGDAGMVERLVDPAHGRLADRMAQPPGAEHRDADRFGIALDRLPQQLAPGEAALDAGHGFLEIVHDQRYQRQAEVDADAPERNAGAMVEPQPVRQRRLEILRQCGFQEMSPERGMALQPGMRIDLLHERLGRTVVLVADADADSRQIVDEKVDPMIRRDDDQHIRPAGGEAAPDLVEGCLELVAMVRGHLVPVAGDDRPVAGRENADEASHGRRAPVPVLPAGLSARASAQ